MTRDCFHCEVSGKVQGVWFRASTQDKASELGLGGWVKNLANGHVEVYACGETEGLEELKAWLQHGPPLAQVSKVEYHLPEMVFYQEFLVKD